MMAVRITYTGIMTPSLVQISGNIPMNPIKFTPISLSSSIVGTRPVAHWYAFCPLYHQLVLDHVAPLRVRKVE